MTVIDIRMRAHQINRERRHAQLREIIYARPGFSFDVDALASRVRSAMQRGDLVAVLAIAYDQSIDEHVRREAVALGRKYYLAHRQAFLIGASPLGASTAARAQPRMLWRPNLSNPRDCSSPRGHSRHRDITRFSTSPGGGFSYRSGVDR